MVYVPNKSAGWTHKNLVLLSKATGIQNHLRELCKKYQWRVANQVETVKELIRASEQEPMSAIVVDDVEDKCSLEVALQLRTMPATLMKPIIVFMSDAWKNDINLLKRTLNVCVMLRPLTIAKFGQTFDEMIKLWETAVFIAIRKIDGMAYPSQFDAMVKILEKLKTVPAAVGISAVIQGRYLELRGESKSAEKILLDGLKLSPKDPHLLFGIARFYIRNGMPKIALRFLDTLRSSYGDTTLFDLDSSFAAMQIGKFQKSIDSLMHFRARGDESEAINSNIQKLLISEGKVLELENQFSDKKQVIQKILSDWDKLEAIGA